MSKFTQTLGNIFLWTYERGSRPYDIIVVLILLFIFLTPHSCLRKTARHATFDKPPVAAGEPAKTND
jgi:hypothetical protein